MKLYSRKYHCHVERQVHFGIGQSVRTACGMVLFSRHVMVNIHSGNDGAIITDDWGRVTCKRCLVTNDGRLRKLIAIEYAIPTIFDHASLCGEEWLLDHALDISKEVIDSQDIQVKTNERVITLSNSMRVKDRKQVMRDFVHQC